MQIKRREISKKNFHLLTHEEQQQRIASVKHERFFQIIFLPVFIILLISALFIYPTNKAVLLLRGGFVMLDLMALWLSSGELHYYYSHIKNK